MPFIWQYPSFNSNLMTMIFDDNNIQFRFELVNIWLYYIMNWGDYMDSENCLWIRINNMLCCNWLCGWCTLCIISKRYISCRPLKSEVKLYILISHNLRACVRIRSRDCKSRNPHVADVMASHLVASVHYFGRLAGKGCLWNLCW